MSGHPVGCSRRWRAWPGVAGFVTLLAMCLLVSGCGSKAPRASAGGSDIAVGGGSASQRGGGYYLDDGPDAIVPANLDLIPDARPRIEPLHRPALRPYSALGQRFVPMTSLQPYRARGHASWYGRRFHGKPTAIGEPYDMYAMTAAHPTLPLPSYVRVTNVANGRSVVVRVNDRGPFLRERLIDLSYAAAHRLGYVNAGSAMVEVEAILPGEILAESSATLEPGAPIVASAPAEPRPIVPLAPETGAQPSEARPAPGQVQPPARPTPPVVPVASVTSGNEAGAYLQLGAFSTRSGADGLADRFRAEMGLLADRLHLYDEGGRYRLQLGPFTSVDEARDMASRIGALFNLQPFVVIR